MKICIVSSSGGHLIKTYFLKEWWAQHERLWITRQDTITKHLLSSEKVVYGFFPENRHLKHFFAHLFLALRVLWRYQPDLVFSMGAGIAPPFFMVSKLLGIKTVFIETFIFRARPTLSGRIIYNLRLADTFLIQNQQLKKWYPMAQYWGKVVDV